MSSLDALDRGRQIVRNRLGKVPTLGPSQGAIVTALRSEIETLELLIASKDTELALLRQELVESNKQKAFNKAERLSGMTDENKPSFAMNLRGMDSPKDSLGVTLVESIENTSKRRRDEIFAHIEKVLQVNKIEQMNKAIEKLISVETKYSELVRAVCIRDRVDINKVSHQDMVRSLRSGEPLKSSTQKEIQTKSGIAWTFH
jgi:hypothetical protein